MAESIGLQLRRAREARRISQEQAAQATRIKIHYIQALESSNLAVIPSRAQARGFLRAYAEYLQLDAEQLVRQLDAPPGETEAPAPPQPVLASEEQRDASEEAARSDRIFIEIGQRLQGQRELLGLSLDDVERHTHLRQRYLRALEAGDLSGLPSPVQGRGMLNNYASFLGLDPEPLLLRFADGLQVRLAARQASTSEIATRPLSQQDQPDGAASRTRRILSSDLLIGGLLVVFLAAFVLWGAIRIFTLRSEQEVVPTSPSIADVLLATSSPTISPTLAAATPTVIAAPGIQATAEITDVVALQATLLAGGGAERVSVYVTVHQRAWMRATVDGEMVFQGRVLPGSAYTYDGDEQVEILTGNGAALQIFYNQQDLGLMGAEDQIVQWIFTREGIATPTPTLTPEFTPTPRATVTPAPTRTLPPGFFPVPTVPEP